MKRISVLLALSAFLGLTDIALAQSRAIGANQVVIDNGSQGRLTIIYTGTGNETLEIGNGGFGAEFPYATEGQTLRHNGAGFDSSSILFNTGTQVHTRGGMVHALRTVTESTDLTETDHIVLVPWTECTDVDITLPAPSVGRVIVVRMIDNCQECGECQGGVVVYPNNGELIEGGSDFWLPYWSPGVTLVSDGTNWYSIGSPTFFF